VQDLIESKGLAYVYHSGFPPLRDPIVLVHGLCGFDRLFALRRPVAEYFPGIAAHLLANGHRVYSARLSPTAGIARRAADLKRFLEREVPAGKVHILGHSLGGLDARYMVSKLGMDHRVATITTLGTPHRGTTFADWGMRWFSRILVPMLRRLGIPHQAFYDLMTDSCREFNEEVANVPGVRYYSIAGQCEKAWLLPEWRLSHAIVGKAEGPNDGVVSVASAAWGEHQDVWSGDHLNLVNWPNRLARRKGVWTDRGEAYSQHLGRLVQAGF